MYMSSVTLRVANERDLAAMLAIYEPSVRNSTVSFEIEPPTPEVFAERFAAIASRFPWVVAEREGQVLGYTYAERPFSRAAYQWTVDSALYIREDVRHTGLGRTLTTALINLLGLMGFHRLYGVIVASNEPSLALTRSMGFTEEARFRRAGHKFGQWHDVVWMGREIRPLSDSPAPPLSMADLTEDQIRDALQTC